MSENFQVILSLICILMFLGGVFLWGFRTGIKYVSKDLEEMIKENKIIMDFINDGAKKK